jgi:hypothetical protein
VSTPAEQLQAFIDGPDQAEATLAMTKWMFIKTAEVNGTLKAHTQILAAIARRLGITADEFRELADDREGPP